MGNVTSILDIVISVITVMANLLGKYLRSYDIEDLNDPDRRKNAADYFIRKWKKKIEDLILHYDEFLDPEFVQKEVFSKIVINRNNVKEISRFLDNRNDWKTRRGALITIKNATISSNTDILAKVKEVSRGDNRFENRIEAYNVLYEKLSEESVDDLLWGVENDSRAKSRLNCIDKLTQVGVNDNRISRTVKNLFENEEKKEIIEKLIEMCGELQMKDFFNKLIGFLDNDDRHLSQAAAIALLKICDIRALSHVEEKCLKVCDMRYRQGIIQAFEVKKGSREAQEIIERYMDQHPDERSVVTPVLAGLYEQGG